jgi:hypothetical protein
MLQDPATMLAVFHAALNVVLVAAIGGKVLLMWVVVAKFSPGWQEQIMRSIAATCGLLLYLGAKALGLSLPMFMLGALTQGGAYVTGFLGALMPAMLGFLLAWHVTRYFNSRDARRNLVGMRILALVMAVALVLYIDTYIAAVDAAHADGLKMLLPNLTFVLAIMLYAVFRYYPIPVAETTAALLVLALGGSLFVGTAHAQPWQPQTLSADPADRQHAVGARTNSIPACCPDTAAAAAPGNEIHAQPACR